MRNRHCVCTSSIHKAPVLGDMTARLGYYVKPGQRLEWRTALPLIVLGWGKPTPRRARDGSDSQTNRMTEEQFATWDRIWRGFQEDLSRPLNAWRVACRRRERALYPAGSTGNGHSGDPRSDSNTLILSTQCGLPRDFSAPRLRNAGGQDLAGLAVDQFKSERGRAAAGDGACGSVAGGLDGP